jgi:hypothetical protein
MAQTDPIRAVSAYLRSVSGVAAIVSSRVFVEDLPEAENSSMPRSTVVVSSGGGGLMGHGQQFGDRRVDIRCYGATARLSRELHNEVRAAMKALGPSKVADTNSTFVLLLWARLSTDGTTARDVGTDWPVTGSSWQVLAADVPA